MEKEPTSFKKSKIFITPGLEDTVLSELDVVNVWREYLAIKICQKFSQRETYQWPMAQLSVHRVFKFIPYSYFHSTYKLHKLRGYHKLHNNKHNLVNQSSLHCLHRYLTCTYKQFTCTHWQLYIACANYITNEHTLYVLIPKLLLLLE